jgi:mercuric ion transport protein
MRRLVNPAALAAPLALLGGAGALAASAACCVLPLGLGLAGLGGAWLGALGPIAELRPALLGVAALALVLGWALALRRRRCEAGVCATRRRTLVGLAGATLLTALAVGWDGIEPALMAALFRLGGAA